MLRRRIAVIDQKFRAALTSQPVTPGPTMADARTVAPCTPRMTPGAMICSPPPTSAKALNPSTLGLVSGSHVPLAYPSQRTSLLAMCQPVGPVRVTDAFATPKLPLSCRALLDTDVTSAASSL